MGNFSSGGANSSAVRAKDIRCSKVQEMILDDQEMRVKWLESCKMVADLNSKQLPRRQFEFLRDIMNGYALVYERHRDYLEDKPNVSSWRSNSVQVKVSAPSTAVSQQGIRTGNLKKSGKGISAKRINASGSKISKKISASGVASKAKRKSGKDLLIDLVKKLRN